MPVLEVTIDPTGAVTGGRVVEGAIGGMTRKASQFEDSLASLKRLLATALTGYGITKTAKAFLDAAAEAENYRTRLRAVIGAVEEADTLYERIAKWAAINPIDTDEAIASFVLLKAAAVQNTEGALAAIADLSTVMGRDMRDVSAAVVSGETESLRRLGILVDKSGRQAIIQSGNVRIAVNKDIDSIRQGIIAVIDHNFKGAMQSAGDTWSGIMKTMGGMWTEFERDVMGASGSGGPFDAMRRSVILLRDEWGAFATSDSYKPFIRDVQKQTLATFDLTLAGISGLLSALEGFGNFAANMPNTAGLGLLGLAFLGPKGRFIAVAAGLIKDMYDLTPAKTPGIAGFNMDDLEALRNGKLPAVPEISQDVKIRFDASGLQKGIQKFRDSLKAAEAGTLPVSAGVNQIRTAVEAVNNAVEGKPFWKSDKGKSLVKNAQREGDTIAAYLEGIKKAQEAAERLKSDVAAGESAFRSSLAWGNMQGLLPDAEYVKILMKDFEDMKKKLSLTGVNAEDWMNWTEPMRQAFAPILAIQSKLANTNLDGLKTLFDAGAVSVEQYRQGLENLKLQFGGFPLVIGQIDAAMKGLDTSLSVTTKNMETLIREAESALADQLAEVPDALSGAFAGAIAYGEDLGETLRNLAQDIAYTTLKATILKAIFGFLGIGGSIGSGLSGGVSDVWRTKKAVSAASLSRGIDSATAPTRAGTSSGATGTGERATTTNISIQAVDAQSFVRLLERNKGAVVSLVAENIRNNGVVRSAAKS